MLPRSQGKDARTPVDRPVVGALAVHAAVREKWGLREVVDQVAPTKGDVSVGTLVEVMVLNRLLNPQAMDAVGEWAAGAAVTDLDGLTADQLNDDRLGRMRETVAERPFVAKRRDAEHRREEGQPRHAPPPRPPLAHPTRDPQTPRPPRQGAANL